MAGYGGAADLVEGGGLHQHLLGHQLHLLGGHGEILQGSYQVVLEALEPPGHPIGLAGKTRFDLLLDLAAASFQLADLLKQGCALLLQLRKGQLLPGGW